MKIFGQQNPVDRPNSPPKTSRLYLRNHTRPKLFSRQKHTDIDRFTIHSGGAFCVKLWHNRRREYLGRGFGNF